MSTRQPTDRPIVITHTCLECGYTSEVGVITNKVQCPRCGVVNDWWLEGDDPPVNHREATEDLVVDPNG